MENRTEISDETWNVVHEYVNNCHRDLVSNIKALYAKNVVREDVATMEGFVAVEPQVGDIITTSGENPTAWILLTDSGKCLLLAGQETEDVDWFFHFGPISIYRTK